MKNKAIIGTGVAGIICFIVGGYYYWVTVQVAALLAGSQGDNSLNRQAWLWFVTFCVGVVLILASGFSSLVSRTHNRTLSAA